LRQLPGLRGRRLFSLFSDRHTPFRSLTGKGGACHAFAIAHPVFGGHMSRRIGDFILCDPPSLFFAPPRRVPSDGLPPKPNGADGVIRVGENVTRRVFARQRQGRLYFLRYCIA